MTFEPLCPYADEVDAAADNDGSHDGKSPEDGLGDYGMILNVVVKIIY